MASTTTSADGRHARRERSRQAVIEAVFGLVQEGKIPPSVDDVAERAGVSVSSIFRTFDGLPDLQRQALDFFQLEFAHLFVVEDADVDRRARVLAHVRSRARALRGGGRVAAYRPCAGARPRADGRGHVAAAPTPRRPDVRALRPKPGNCRPLKAANLVALIDATTSPEAFEVMSGVHARSPRQISRTVPPLDALLQQWIPDVQEITP